ncbi:MAG: hypothetical protein ACKOA4_03445 [Haliscomenobacter sp.]
MFSSRVHTKIFPMALFISTALNCGTASDGWVQYNGGTFSIEHPSDWGVQVQEDGLIRVKGNTAQAMLWPSLIAQTIGPWEAQAMLSRFANRLLPGYTWGQVSVEAGNMLRAQGKPDAGKIAVAFLNWVPVQGNTLCTFYACEAPTASFAQLAETFTRILTSFRPADEAKAEAPKIAYASFSDPAEQAFTVEYPGNWKIEGGLYRAAATDVRSHVRITSPDGAILLFIGDNELPYFTLPNAMLEWTGFREGSWYSPGYGNNMLVQRYYPGVNFALQYAARIAQAPPTILQQQDRPDLARQLMGLQEITTYGINQRMDAGDVRFTFPSNNGQRSGYVFANTLKVEGNGNGIWHVEQLIGYVAPPERAQEAADILGRVVRSFQINPQWARMQSNLSANVSKIVAETNQVISGIISDVYENRTQAQDRSNRRFDDYIRGVERVADENGKVYEVKSGNNYYWINQFEQVVGTDIYQNPDLTRFRQLIRIE